MQNISLYGMSYSYKLFRDMKGDRPREGKREKGTENIAM